MNAKNRLCLGVFILSICIFPFLSACGRTPAAIQPGAVADSRLPSEITTQFPDGILQLHGYTSAKRVDYEYWYPGYYLPIMSIGEANTIYSVSYLPADPKAAFSHYQKLLGDSSGDPFASGRIDRYDVFADISASPEISLVVQTFENKMVENEALTMIFEKYIPAAFFVKFTSREIDTFLDQGETINAVSFAYKGKPGDIVDYYRNLIDQSQVLQNNDQTDVVGEIGNGSMTLDAQIDSVPGEVRFIITEKDTFNVMVLKDAAEQR